MNRITFAIAGILFPALLFGQPKQEIPTLRSAPVSMSIPPFHLFPPSTAAAQADGSGQTPGEAGAANVKATTRPHMIELSSANWRPLTTSEKFGFFYRDMLHWGTHASLVFDTGLSYATSDRSYLGNGARGFFTRYGLNAADEANFTFFNAFFFPTIFHQDPRYIPSDHGRTVPRLAYALSRVLVTRADSGESQVNASRLMGDFFATTISSIMFSSYGADIGARGNFADYGLNLATDAAFDVFKEFWPDLARKMKLNLWLRNVVRGALRDYVRVR